MYFDLSQPGAAGNAYQAALNQQAQMRQASGIGNPTAPSTAQDASLVASLKAQQNLANQQEKARFDKMMALAAQFGAGQQRRNQTLYGQEMGAGNQDLINRGLFNSSAATALRTTADNNLAQRNADVADQQTKMQLGVLGDVQTQRTDPGLIAQLFSQPRSAGNTSALSALLGNPGVTLFDTGGGSTQVKPARR